MLKFKAMLLVGALALGASAVEASTISSGPATGSIGAFGFPDSQTYGQVFTASETGVLDSFSLSLNGSVGGNLYGGIGLWNGGSSFDFGHGVSNVLFQSAETASISGPTTYTFNPNINVTAGSIYVAFLSVFGTNATGRTTMPIIGAGSSNALVNYFVWNNGNGGPASTSWNYFFNGGDAQFSANITPSAVPLPAALPLLVAGLGALGVVSRKRRQKTKENAS